MYTALQVARSLTGGKVFISSRLLFFLSKCGHAPEWCSKVVDMPLRMGKVPIAGVLITGAFGALAFMTVANAEEVWIVV